MPADKQTHYRVFAFYNGIAMSKLFSSKESVKDFVTIHDEDVYKDSELDVENATRALDRYETEIRSLWSRDLTNDEMCEYISKKYKSFDEFNDTWFELVQLLIYKKAIKEEKGRNGLFVEKIE